MTDPTALALTPARSEALFAALQFHRDTDDDDPRAVVETAQTFHIFLTADGIPFDGEQVFSNLMVRG